MYHVHGAFEWVGSIEFGIFRPEACQGLKSYNQLGLGSNELPKHNLVDKTVADRIEF